jgi:4-diphosphocytidyl-2-C-methyl-D-erythritol kinase
VKAHAKINLALLVGPRRPDGKHEIATVLQRIELADEVDLEASDRTEVEGFAEDTLVKTALRAIGVTARARIEKRIPVAAGLGGGSSDAAAALRLANGMLDEPLGPRALHGLAVGLGSDVPFFLREGPQLGRGAGADLAQLELPQDYWVVLVLPTGARKESTKAVYDAFEGEAGFEERCETLMAALDARDLAALPSNDLAASPLADELRAAGAFRADVSGAGPIVYGLFADRSQADEASRLLGSRGATWTTRPAW